MAGQCFQALVHRRHFHQRLVDGQHQPCFLALADGLGPGFESLTLADDRPRLVEQCGACLGEAGHPARAVE